MTEPLFAAARERLGGVEARGFGGSSPAGVMTALAESEEIDLIVVGSPHRGAIGRALIGSVADNLLYGSPRPVVVAPRGYAGERHEPFRRIAVGHDGTPEADAASERRLDGPPARMLAGACEDAGLPVVGSRGYGPVLRVLLGSVSTRLIHIAPCPVLVIPRPDGGGRAA